MGFESQPWQASTSLYRSLLDWFPVSSQVDGAACCHKSNKLDANRLTFLAGKTLIARQIGKMLNAAEPKIVNGPEILNKYVGASEENVRELFKDAEKEQAEKGEDSGLHVIIFDEIDAICKQRGSVSSGTGVHDTVVNQLLTKIDGVDALNNILLIGRSTFRLAIRRLSSHLQSDGT